MASEMIQEVLRAEKDAAAQNEAKAAADSAIASAREEQTRILSEAKTKADKIFEEARGKAQTQCDNLKQQSKAREDDAVAAVIQYIIP